MTILFQGSELLKVANKDESLADILNDINGIAERAYPSTPIEESRLRVANFIAQHKAWWSASGNYTPTRYQNRSATDYLELFKERLQTWAYHLHTGDPVQDWLQVLDKCAVLMAETVPCQRLYLYEEWTD